MKKPRAISSEKFKVKMAGFEDGAGGRPMNDKWGELNDYSKGYNDGLAAKKAYAKKLRWK